MLTVMNRTRYQRYRAEKTTRSREAAVVHDLVLPILLFGGMGAITWAIRGTDGWGGVDGTIVPGLTWGAIWYYLCYRKGIDARGMVLWLGLGVAVGGELGYGQYVSWIRGMFQVADGTIPIAPWHGYAWLVICGIGWAAPGGIALGWALSGKSSVLDWALRLILFAALIAISHGAVVDLLGKVFVRVCPTLLFPHYGSGIYQGVVHAHQERTIYTNSQNFAFVLWWIAALVVAALRKDRSTLAVGATIGGGFGPGFMLSTIWCLGYSYAPNYVDWWKMWELNAGFNLGLLCVPALWWAIRQVDKAHDPNGVPLIAADSGIAPPAQAEMLRSACSVPFVCVVLLFTFLESFLSPGVLLAAFYAGALCFASLFADSGAAAEGRARVSLSFSVFLLLFVLLRGATCNLGALLGLYDIGLTGQYSWPTARMVTFAPMALLLVSVTLAHMWRSIKPPQGIQGDHPEPGKIGVRMIDLMTGIGVVGAATIWPAKIGVLYALGLCIALFAINRLNRRFDAMDPH
jgi:hypothetical protein